MTKNVLLALPVADALDHRRVVFLVREDDRARNELEEGRECSVVGNVRRGEKKRGFLSMEVGKFAFELHVIVGCAGDIARAARASPNGVNRLVHRRQHRWVLAHAEIIVGAPYRNLARVILPTK